MTRRAPSASWGRTSWACILRRRSISSPWSCAQDCGRPISSRWSTPTPRGPRISAIWSEDTNRAGGALPLRHRDPLDNSTLTGLIQLEPSSGGRGVGSRKWGRTRVLSLPAREIQRAVTATGTGMPGSGPSSPGSVAWTTEPIAPRVYTGRRWSGYKRERNDVHKRVALMAHR